MEKVTYQYLGLKDYQETWDYQKVLLKSVVARKLSNRHLAPEDPAFEIQQHHLLFCHHPLVYTLGKSGSLDNLLLNEQELATAEIDFYKINRGGDITFHGPGQVVGYPILDMDLFFTDIHKYVRFLEEIIIRTLADYGITGTRIKGFTGVWIEGENGGPNRKICAIGVHLSRWVTMHGFAFNVNTDLKYFNYIVPCGINDADKTVTSLAQELGKEVDITAVMTRLKFHFTELFDCELVEG
ncbi:MAG: lipoyl(octanoyl) transferase LipB [Saprospiraceae bacterium]